MSGCRKSNGKRLNSVKLNDEKYLLAKNTPNAVIQKKLAQMFESEFNSKVVGYLEDAIELSLNGQQEKGKIFGCFLILSFFLLLDNVEKIVELEPQQLSKSMSEEWLSEMCSDITKDVEKKHSWLKLKWTKVAVVGEFPQKSDDDSFCSIALVSKSDLLEAIKKSEEVHSEEIMKILNDDSEEFAYVEIDDIDRGQFSIILTI